MPSTTSIKKWIYILPTNLAILYWKIIYFVYHGHNYRKTSNLEHSDKSEIELIYKNSRRC